MGFKDQAVLSRLTQTATITHSKLAMKHIKVVLEYGAAYLSFTLGLSTPTTTTKIKKKTKLY